jgi:hypothetical protein
VHADSSRTHVLLKIMRYITHVILWATAPDVRGHGCTPRASVSSVRICVHLCPRCVSRANHGNGHRVRMHEAAIHTALQIHTVQIHTACASAQMCVCTAVCTEMHTALHLSAAALAVRGIYMRPYRRRRRRMFRPKKYTKYDTYTTVL